MPVINGVDPNSFLTDDVIMKEALRLLKNALVVTPLVYRNVEQVFGKVGDTINIKLPYRVKSASGRTLVKQPMVDQTIAFPIDRQEHVGLEFTVRDRTLTLEMFSERYLKSGIVQIAHQIDRSVLNAMRRRFFFSSGTPGTAISSDDVTLAGAYQDMVGVPDDGMRRSIFHPLDRAVISNEIKDMSNENLAKMALQRGYMGPLSNYDCFSTAQVPTHTVGDHGGTPLVNGAGQTGASLVCDGGSNSTTDFLLEGDVFTIADVYEINPQTYQSTGRLQRFVVTSDVDTDGSGNFTVSISPSINDGTLTTVDEDGNTISLAAYQNVTAAPANNAAITVIGSANTTYRQEYLFHRDAVALAMVDLELPSTAVVKSRVRDPDSGLSMSLTGAYDISNHSEIHRIDAVWGTKVIYGELGHRLFSAAG